MLLMLLKKLVRLGCISKGFLCGSHQPEVFDFTRRFGSSLLPSSVVMAYRVCVCVICVKVTANDEWDKIKLKLKLNGCLLTVCGWVR